MADVCSIRETGKVVAVDILTELDRLSVLSIKNQLRALVNKKGKKLLLINFSRVDHINSTIVGALVSIQGMVRGKKGELALCCVQPNVQRTLDLIGASKIINIYETEETALAGLGN